MDEQRWARLDREMGDWHYTIKSMQCEKCVNKISDPMKCKEFPDGKPNYVMKVESDCPKFEQQK